MPAQQLPQALRRQVTRWTNPLDIELTVLLYTGTGVAKVDRSRNPSGETKVTWKPGESIELSSDFDDAIQKLDDSGTVVGGRCPQLLKDGVRHVVHPSIDVAASDADSTQDALIETMKQKAELEAKLKLAEARALDSAEKQAATKLAEEQAVEAAKARELAEETLKLQKSENERLARELAELRAQVAKADAPAAPAAETEADAPKKGAKK